MNAMTRRSLLTNVTRGHHREAPGATAPPTEVRGENGGERDDGATNVAGDVPEMPPVARRVEIGELCAKPRRQAQRHRRGLECSECIQALSAPELLSRRSGGRCCRAGPTHSSSSRTLHCAATRATTHDGASLLCGAMASPSCVSGIARASRGPSTIHSEAKSAPRPLHQAKRVRRVQLA